MSLKKIALVTLVTSLFNLHASVTIDSAARFANTAGTSLTDSPIIIDDYGFMSGVNSIAMGNDIIGVTNIAMAGGNITGVNNLEMAGDISGANDLTLSGDLYGQGDLYMSGNLYGVENIHMLVATSPAQALSTLSAFQKMVTPSVGQLPRDQRANF